MSLASKSKDLSRSSARSTRRAAAYEDDAEQTVREIVAAQAKLAGERRDTAPGLRQKRKKKSST